MLAMSILQTISTELNVNPRQVEAVMALLGEGATVPFIARYRKEVTGGLTDVQLRTLVERLDYLQELESRRSTILASIEEQGLLTADLKNTILAADTKIRLEDLYLPYKPKRRTKAQIAREAGLEPLALALLQQPTLMPIVEAESYLNEEQGITTPMLALEGAQQILMEIFSENAVVLDSLRKYFAEYGFIVSKVAKDKEKEGVKFSDYFDFSERIKTIPSHRSLALFRGRKAGFLQLELGFMEAAQDEHCQSLIAQQFSIAQKGRAAEAWLFETVTKTWKIKLQVKLELELMSALKERADEEAIRVFRDNLGHLLMTAPAGNHNVLGLDPGLRTGVKVVAVDGTGKLLDYMAIYPHVPRNEWEKSLTMLATLCKKHAIKLISIGNGTASRETDQLVAELIKQYPELGLTKIIVSEAGASVYSASELASNEFPDLDVSFRGAVSIARRLQDPLAELVKIDPKSIGIGQYQHDVNQVKLSHTLTAVVEDCVNAVGADINTASVPLLTSISGLNASIAKNIVQYREQHGRFKNRDEIKKVPRLGIKTFEQAVGFLRIMGGDNPLDASAVHPESYPIIDQILQTVHKPIEDVMGNSELLNSLDPKQFITAEFGLPTIKDIFNELHKPGRDPRPEFKMAKFTEGIHQISDLKPGVQLEGTITNVANFGAFVDIGVHQDGLVHISEIANHFVDDIHKVVKVGQIVQVTVLDVDLARNRIQLSMKTEKHNKGEKKIVPPTTALKKVRPEKFSSSLAEKLKDALKK